MRNLRLIGGITLLLFLVSSCVKEVSSYTEEIPVGNIVMRSQSPLRVSDNMILEITQITDNRCPIGQVCSSSGEVTIEFKAYINSAYVNFSVNYADMNEVSGSTANCEGNTIQILNVNPFPYSDTQVKLEDYRVELKVEKL